MRYRNRKKSIAQKHSKSKEQMIDDIVSLGESYGRFITDETWIERLEALSNVLRELLKTLSRRTIERMYKCRDSDKYGALLCLFVLCAYRIYAMCNGNDEWVELIESEIETVLSALRDKNFSEAVFLILERYAIVEGYYQNHTNNE